MFAVAQNFLMKDAFFSLKYNFVIQTGFSSLLCISLQEVKQYEVVAGAVIIAAFSFIKPNKFCMWLHGALVPNKELLRRSL